MCETSAVSKYIEIYDKIKLNSNSIDETISSLSKEIGINNMTNSIGLISTVSIARALGFKVYKGEVVGQFNSVLDIDDNLALERGAVGIIRMSDKLDTKIDRYAIAHMIGHYLLHYEKGQTFYEAYRDYEICSIDKQIEADAFASKLLMPEEEFNRIYSIASDVGNCVMMEVAFGVPVSRIRERMIQLGIV